MNADLVQQPAASQRAPQTLWRKSQGLHPRVGCKSDTAGGGAGDNTDSLSCISQGSDNGRCLRRTRRIDGRPSPQALHRGKQAANKKTSVAEPAVCRVYDGEDSAGERRPAAEQHTNHPAQESTKHVHLSPSGSAVCLLTAFYLELISSSGFYCICLI